MKWDFKNYKKHSIEELKKLLSPIEYSVTQEDDTERAFTGDKWNETGDGIYVDVVSGEPLFSSKDKYDAGCGWPSFTQPLPNTKLIEKADYKLWASRTEVRSSLANSHLGHVFNDGPGPRGLRYCINSASLRFIPKEKMAEMGYADYLSIFVTDP